MARIVTGRIHVTGDLVARTALHVGGMGEDVTSDMPLARDGAGRLVVPGTSLAGAFRAWCERAFPAAGIKAIWGTADDDGVASSVFIEDIVAGTEDSLHVEVRDGVGIDREWGTAATNIKYDRAVLPRGTRLPLRMTIEHDAETATAAEQMAAGLVAALAAGEVALGAAKTRGLGRVTLENASIERFDVGSRAGTLALLRRLAWDAPGGGPADARPPASAKISPRPAPHAPPRLAVEIDWHPLGPLMVKAGADGVAVDTLPLMGGREGGLSPLLPGSSIKGALRGQAERIIRTLLDLPLPGGDDDRSRFLEQLRGVPLVDVVFGVAGEAAGRGVAATKPAGDVRDDDVLPGLGALAVEDCYGQCRIARDAWAKVLEAGIDPPPGQKESPLHAALAKAGLEHWTAAFHVAVDRWTGGAADNLLFTVMEPHGVAWEPIRLVLDLERLPRAAWPAAVMLVLLLVRDLAQGRLPLGYGVNRGLGSLAVEAVRIRGRGLGNGLEPLTELDLPAGDVAGAPAELRSALDAAWHAWLASVAASPTTAENP
jgi:CRISPR/Cas system CSM-associated protein Csm3 (group 7 of RAMP superfamily)